MNTELRNLKASIDLFNRDLSWDFFAHELHRYYYFCVHFWESVQEDPESIDMLAEYHGHIAQLRVMLENGDKDWVNGDWKEEMRRAYVYGCTRIRMYNEDDAEIIERSVDYLLELEDDLDPKDRILEHGKYRLVQEELSRRGLDQPTNQDVKL